MTKHHRNGGKASSNLALWVSPRASLDVWPREKISGTAGNGNPVVQSVASHYTD